MIIKKSERKKHANAPSCVAYEYEHGDEDIDIAFIEIRGKYPEKGSAMNKICKEMVFVVGGKGKIEIDEKSYSLNEGDTVLIQPNQKYFFEGNIDLIFSCHPSFNSKNYVRCE